MIIRILLIFLLLDFSGNTQVKKPKNSWSRGTLYGHWGYNRAYYTQSNIRFAGYGYDFTMKNVKAHDRPERFSKVYFDPKRITVPQFNARIGYMFKDHWGISFGYDHLKYVLANGNQVRISGTIDEGIDKVTNLSGNYEDYSFTTNEKTFHYENSNGLNYIRLELSRIDQWYSTKSKNFAISTSISAGVGSLLSYNDFTFAGRKDVITVSMSGYGLSGHLGARLEFFKHLYLQTNASGGFMHQINVKTRPNDPSAFARQRFGFAEFNCVIGFLFYIRPTNDCNSCPHW